MVWSVIGLQSQMVRVFLNTSTFGIGIEYEKQNSTPDCYSDASNVFQAASSNSRLKALGSAGVIFTFSFAP